MSNAIFWKNLSKDCFEHSGQLCIALDRIIPLIPDPEGDGMEACEMLKMLSRLEHFHNADMCQEINCLERPPTLQDVSKITKKKAA